MSLFVTVYKRPYGATEEIQVTHVRPEDAVWLNANAVAVGLEDLGGFFAIYARWGVAPDGEPLEHTHFVRGGQSCEDALAEVVIAVKKLKEQTP